jgi:hypothetical protein
MLRLRHPAVAFAALLCFIPLAACSAQPPDACSDLASAIDSVPGGAVFLASYPTAKIDQLGGTAFLYDNALAAIALIGCREPQKAARIGDAILFALDHDRYWHDGRLRNAYVAGPVGADEPVKLAGWWDKVQNKWVEDRYQVGSDSGNLAWAILALLALDRASSDHRYLNGAVRIAGWLTRFRTNKYPGGFTGGTFGYEPLPQIEHWKSTEHNSDLAAAFYGLAQATHDTRWLGGARGAQSFVEAMWSADCNCFAAGTGEDGASRNDFLALDAQIFPLLATPGVMKKYAAVFATISNKLSDDGGVSYGVAKGGLWTEGTAQLALAQELSGSGDAAARLIKALGRLRTADGSYYAADIKDLPTGFGLDTNPAQSRQYFHLPHLGATAWVALAEKGYNPFVVIDKAP